MNEWIFDLEKQFDGNKRQRLTICVHFAIPSSFSAGNSSSIGKRSKFVDWQQDLAWLGVVGGLTVQFLDQSEQITCQQACLLYYIIFTCWKWWLVSTLLFNHALCIEFHSHWIDEHFGYGTKGLKA